MKKLVLVYPPFCTPTSPPYSITNIYSQIKSEDSKLFEIKALDLNVEYHFESFKKYHDYFKNNNWEDYDEISKKCLEEFNDEYSKNHELILKNKKPKLFDYLLELILKEEPDFVAFSIVYSSQVFYAYALIKELKLRGIKTIIGGSATSAKLKNSADYFFEDLDSFKDFLNIKSKEEELDFSIHDLKKYFSPSTVLPLKTSSTCYYKKCTFCSHYTNQKYEEYDLKLIEKTIKKNKNKYYFLIDDMIPAERLLSIAKILKKHGKEWGCQLKPTLTINKNLEELKNLGLKFVVWGVESGNERILKKMKKGITKESTQKTLMNSKKARIINVVYIMFGFPTETKEEFSDTIRFLSDNKENIDLVSTSVFGLQKNTKIYEEPGNYGITKIIEQKRTLLDSKISYEVSEGLNTKEASKLRKSHLKFLNTINKYPRKTNFFREHMFFFE